MRNEFYITYSDLSCGIKELTGVNCSDLLAFKLALAGKISVEGEVSTFGRGWTYVFSDNISGNGKEIAKLIKQHRLGRLVATPWVRNPSSGNKIKTWTWIYNGRVPAAWNKLSVPENYESESLF
jgi:hypothetical protein